MVEHLGDDFQMYLHERKLVIFDKNNKSALVQIMALHKICDKPLSELDRSRLTVASFTKEVNPRLSKPP